MDDPGQASTEAGPHLFGCVEGMKMSKLQCFVYPAVAALSLAAAFSVHAQSFEGADHDAASSRSAATAAVAGAARADVKAALAQARAAHAVDVYGYGYNPLAQARSLKTRAEVQAEVRALRGTNYAQAWYGEDSGSFVLSQQGFRNAAPAVMAGKPAKSGAGQ